MSQRFVSACELAVLEVLLPQGLTPDMRDVAQCLFAPLVLNDDRCGQSVLVPDWQAQLQAWAKMVLMQLQYMADEIGGSAIYLAKGVAVHLSLRDRQMCAEFRGDYKVLARKYDRTEMRVRQIVDAYQKAQYLQRQQGLPGLD
ncbi:Mor transcription activator family protein [Rhodoferax sp.]|uniref:Mor transcription activator family protein n=1 Tax=Rhodoferax sp. TaxID=50421 RepID=UPI00260764E9|nr:Mor transcription activator family protein [Rhodoferax sp.]MDD5479656.1 Mor transcription activator family protein [Rhodoferax sp.]